jgi:hypothetical protein
MTPRKEGKTPEQHSKSDEAQTPLLRREGRLPFDEENEEDVEDQEEPEPSLERTRRESTAIPDHNLKDCKERILKLRIPASTKLKLVDNPPRMFLSALELAKTEPQREEILAFLERFVMALGSEEDEARSARIIGSVENCPPDVYFSFCRKPLVEPEKVKGFVEALQEELDRRVGHRAQLTQELALFAGRRLSGDRSAVTPLLVGPPGTGKSYIISQLAEAMTGAGVKTGTVIQQMTQSGRGDQSEEVPMRLLGTSKKWSNGDCGAIFSSLSKELNQATVVFLDEAEKGGLRNFMVSLLDPKMPLQDSYIKELSGSMDMSFRSLFILAANDDRFFFQGDDDPLGSRVNRIDVVPYSAAELRGVLTELALRDLAIYGVESESKVAAVVDRVMGACGSDAGLRLLENAVKRELFVESTGIRLIRHPAGQELALPMRSQRKAIGFRIGN